MSSTKFPSLDTLCGQARITPNAFQHLALRTENTPPVYSILHRYAGVIEEEALIARLQHAAYGFCTEAGEFMDPLKRVQFYQKQWAGKTREEFIANLREEVGDMLWYCALAADALESSLEEIMLANVRKLEERYKSKTGKPLGFSTEQAINRDLGAEMVALEGERIKAIETAKKDGVSFTIPPGAEFVPAYGPASLKGLAKSEAGTVGEAATPGVIPIQLGREYGKIGEMINQALRNMEPSFQAEPARNVADRDRAAVNQYIATFLAPLVKKFMVEKLVHAINLNQEDPQHDNPDAAEN